MIIDMIDSVDAIDTLLKGHVLIVNDTHIKIMTIDNKRQLVTDDGEIVSWSIFDENTIFKWDETRPYENNPKPKHDFKSDRDFFK